HGGGRSSTGNIVTWREPTNSPGAAEKAKGPRSGADRLGPLCSQIQSLGLADNNAQPVGSFPPKPSIRNIRSASSLAPHGILRRMSYGRIDLSHWPDRRDHGDPVVLRLAVSDMTIVTEEVIESGIPLGEDRWAIQWSPVVAGAIAAGAPSFILVSFGVAIGL